MSTLPSSATSARLRAAANRLRWPVVGLLSLGMIIAYFDRVNLGVAKLVMGKEFGWTETQLGWALSAFFWSYTLLQIPSGVLVDRYGVRLPYIIGFLLWSLSSAAMALTNTLAMLILLRILLGIGESVVTPASMRYIRLHFDEENRGLAVGLYMAGTKIGPALGLPLAAYLVAAFGWRIMFLLIGGLSLVWLIPWMAWVKKDDIAALPRPAQGAGKASADQQRISAGQIMRSPVMWGVIVGTFCYMYFVYYYMNWIPTYFEREHNMSITQTGWFSGASFAGMAIVAAVSGWVADLFIKRGYDAINVRKAFTVGGFVCASAQTLSLFTDSTSIEIFLTIFSLSGLGLATANYWALTQSLIPGGSIAMVVGIQNTAANLAGIVATALTGWMIDATGSFDAPIRSIGIWLVIGTACYLFLVRRKYAPKAVTA
ncbi:MAG: MFS transporter [Bryobacteraceae bacterium]|nr:MFS transporter [Bryobacteraceae bacterium]